MGKILKGSEYKNQLDLQTKVSFEERSSLFETGDSSTIVSKEVLDAQSQARAILQEAKSETAHVRQEAKDLLRQVQQEVEKSKAEGYEAGYQEGLQEVLQHLNNIHLLREKMFQNIEPQMVQLAFSIAEKIIGHQIHENESAILEIIRQALDAALGHKIMVRVHPEDWVVLKAHESEVVKKFEASKVISFQEDATVTRGGCIVESEVGSIDARLETQMTAIRKALEGI